MRLCSFRQGTDTRLGAVFDGRIVDVNRAYAALVAQHSGGRAQALADAKAPSAIIDFLSLGAEGIADATDAIGLALAAPPEWSLTNLLVLPEASAQLLPPIPVPPKIVCVARNYRAHAAEAGRPVSEIPILFPRFANTLVAHGDPVLRPTVSEEFDWEGELAVIIGRAGRHIGAEDAMEYVAGYSVFNDVTVRNYQFRVQQYTAGKNFSHSGPFGPHLVLKDEIPDPHDLELVTTYNDQEVQRTNTGDMIFTVSQLIEHISEFVELEVGDVIPTGTPAGVGFTREPPLFLRPGDTISVSIEGIGTLTNPVLAEEDFNER